MGIDLDGAVVCVTGGARGIGRATAMALAARGASVWIGDLDLEAAESAAKHIGPSARAARLDVSDESSFAAFVAEAQAIGPVSMLVNNAGFMRTGAFDELDAAGHVHEIAVNLTGVVLGTHLVLPGMLERNFGHIVNVASMAAKMSVPGAAVYTATKAGVAAFSAAVRGEILDSDVTITTLLPAAVKTDLLAGVRTDLMRPVGPEAVANAVLRSVQTGQPELSVPRLMRHVGILEEALPERPWNKLKQRLGAQDRLTTDDPQRLSYQEQQRTRAAAVAAVRQQTEQLERPQTPETPGWTGRR